MLGDPKQKQRPRKYEANEQQPMNKLKDVFDFLWAHDHLAFAAGLVRFYATVFVYTGPQTYEIKGIKPKLI